MFWNLVTTFKNTLVELVHGASNMNGTGRYTHDGQALVYSPGLLHHSTDNLPATRPYIKQHQTWKNVAFSDNSKWWLHRPHEETLTNETTLADTSTPPSRR